MIDLPENVHDLLDESAARLEKTSKITEKHWFDYAEKLQPINYSWVTLDVSANHLAADSTNGIVYDNNSEFREELLKFVEAYFSDELISHYREGRLSEIQIVLGAHPPSGEDLNEDMGEDFELNYGHKKQ